MERRGKFVSFRKDEAYVVISRKEQLEKSLKFVIQILQEKNIGFIIIGGTSLLLQDVKVETRDVDIFIPSCNRKSFNNLVKKIKKRAEKIDEFYQTKDLFGIDAAIDKIFYHFLSKGAGIEVGKKTYEPKEVFGETVNLQLPPYYKTTLHSLDMKLSSH